jgi:hypothetical protein
MNGEVLNMLVSLRNTELAALWARFNIHLVVNGGLIATLINIDEQSLGSLYVPAFFFGLLLNIVWLISEYFGRITLKYRDSMLNEFYRSVFPVGKSVEKDFFDYPNWFKRQGHLSYILIGTFTIAWLLLLARAMCLSHLLT